MNHPFLRLNLFQVNVLAAFLLLLSSQSFARPLVTEETSTLGRFTFEATLGIAHRQDDFGSPKRNYTTTLVPISASLGVHRWIDVGFQLMHMNHQLEAGGVHFSGSRNATFSSQLKIAPWPYFGLLTIWHAATSAESNQELPITRGDDAELLLLGSFPTRWPLSLNIGYLFRHGYFSDFGVEGGRSYRVKPADIFETRLALEIPWRKGLHVLGELAYYRAGDSSIAGSDLKDSGGTALDSIVGITWEYETWNLGGGVAFGLLDEEHTSFDLERGAGDTQFRFSLGYKLRPRRPGQ